MYSGNILNTVAIFRHFIFPKDSDTLEKLPPVK